ncbi:DsbA family protein [Aliikangiella maris]|uniref:DsbA family protein n=2 Tax=Aliikangiella maris TaxID=3162458 RepID=A0ABV3MJB9_9GAMM
MHTLNKISLIILFLSIMCSAALAKGQSSVAATINGESITFEQLDSSNKIQIYETELKLFELRSNQLKDILIPKFIQLDNRSKGLTTQQYMDKYIVQSIEISPQKIEEFAKQQKIPDDKLDDGLKDRIRSYLNRQNIATAMESWYQKQLNKHQVSINLKKPIEPKFEIDVGSAPYLGKKDAPVTMIEYSDFECPFCARANDTVKTLLKKYGDKIKFVYKHFPLDFHKNAQKAAEASMCAREQGEDYFWQLHDQMFDDYRNLSVGVIKDKAKALGLDTEQFANCLNTDKYADYVAQDFKQGQQLGVAATPVFFINGRMINGAQPVDIFIDKIEQALAE